MEQLLTYLPDILRICIIPLLGALVTYLCALIKRKAEQVRQTTNNEIVNKYLGMLESTVTNAVLCTKQTYVDALKEKGEFTEEAQKEAFGMAYAAVMESLTEEAKKYLAEITNDLPTFVTKLIEATVSTNK